MPTDLLRATWKQLVDTGDRFPLTFYAVLFDMAPPVAGLFPVGMAEQRRKLVATLSRVVQAATQNTQNPEEPATRPDMGEQLRTLGRDHRRYGAEPAHYPVVGAALIATMAHLVPDWSDEHTTAWTEAFQAVAAAMTEGAAQASEAGIPAWVDAPVLGVNGDLDAVTIEVDLEVEAPDGCFDAGASVWVARADRAGHWVRGRLGDRRPVSVTVALADNNLDSLAVAAVAAGDRLRLAPAPEEALL
jgi:hemoglobin-like flavoprotein